MPTGMKQDINLDHSGQKIYVILGKDILSWICLMVTDCGYDLKWGQRSTILVLEVRHGLLGSETG